MLPFPILPQTGAKRSSLPADINVTWTNVSATVRIAICYLKASLPFLPNPVVDVKPKSGYDRDIVGF
jgi:hypothetical protein